jgi:guanidinoacetate N-methyltransferase
MSSTQDQKKSWLTNKAVFTGHDLLIKGYQVMQDWETPYMKRLAEIATSNGGTILEFGFGMGISAGFIQESDTILKHSVIEAHPDVIEFAKTKFPEQIKNGRLELINGFWEDVWPSLPESSFDGILFDTSPLDQETVFFHYIDVFPIAYKLLKPGGIFTYFSDEATTISDGHKKALNEAGFTDIKFEIFPVEPPAECRYWPYKTIVAPIVHK